MFSVNGTLSGNRSFSSPAMLLIHCWRSDFVDSAAAMRPVANSLTPLRVNSSFWRPDLYFLHALCSVATVMPSPHAIISFRPSCDPLLSPSLSLFLICRVCHSCMHWCNFSSYDLAVFIFSHKNLFQNTLCLMLVCDNVTFTQTFSSRCLSHLTLKHTQIHQDTPRACRAHQR